MRQVNEPQKHRTDNPNSAMCTRLISCTCTNSGGATPGHARSNALAKKLLPWLAPWLAPWLTEISINSISSEVHNSAQKLIYLSLLGLSLIIYHYLSIITSRLRTLSLYHRPATHTKRYTSFIHYSLLNYQ